MIEGLTGWAEERGYRVAWGPAEVVTAARRRLLAHRDRAIRAVLRNVDFPRRNESAEEERLPIADLPTHRTFADFEVHRVTPDHGERQDDRCRSGDESASHA